MSDTVNRWLSLITMAGLAGLFIMNAGGVVDILNAIGTQSSAYVKTVQGR